MKPTRYVFKTDDEGHDYMVPEAHAARFEEMLAEGYRTDDFQAFDDAFGNTKLGRSYQSISFENPKTSDT